VLHIYIYIYDISRLRVNLGSRPTSPAPVRLNKLSHAIPLLVCTVDLIIRNFGLEIDYHDRLFVTLLSLFRQIPVSNFEN